MESSVFRIPPPSPPQEEAAPNPDSDKRENSFKFWNGDEYSGQFSVVKSKQKLVMEGEGVYRTADDQVYQGVWKNDDLKEARKIVFSDRTEFSGNLEEMAIQGEGKYKFKENVRIEGYFENNNLMGNVLLRDPGDHLWRGEVEGGEEFLVRFHPLHSFWQSVTSLPSRERFVYLREYQEEEEEESGEEAR